MGAKKNLPMTVDEIYKAVHEQGKTRKEIAEICNVSASTITRRLQNYEPKEKKEKKKDAGLLARLLARLLGRG